MIVVSGQSSGTRIQLEHDDIVGICQALQATSHDEQATITIAADGEIRVNGIVPRSWKLVRDALIREGVSINEVDRLTQVALQAIRAGD